MLPRAHVWVSHQFSVSIIRKQGVSVLVCYWVSGVSWDVYTVNQVQGNGIFLLQINFLHWFLQFPPLFLVPPLTHIPAYTHTQTHIHTHTTPPATVHRRLCRGVGSPSLRPVPRLFVVPVVFRSFAPSALGGFTKKNSQLRTYVVRFGADFGLCRMWETWVVQGVGDMECLPCAYGTAVRNSSLRPVVVRTGVGNLLFRPGLVCIGVGKPSPHPVQVHRRVGNLSLRPSECLTPEQCCCFAR